MKTKQDELRTLKSQICSLMVQT